MEIEKINVEWLKQQNFTLQKGVTIDGAFVKNLKCIVDDRGDVMELWSQNWKEFKDGTILNCTHGYQSATDSRVVKGWHLHKIHTDQLTCTRGKLQVSLIDIREDSPTFGHANFVIFSTAQPRFLKIPPGIMHGWKTLSDHETIVVNFQTHAYDLADEFKFPWDCVMENIWGPHNG